MPPLRPSALDISFPEIADQIRAEDATAAQRRARFGPSASGRKDANIAKRKKVNSTVDARVSEILSARTNDVCMDTNYLFLMQAPKRRHSTPNKENSGPIGGPSKNGLPGMMYIDPYRQSS